MAIQDLQRALQMFAGGVQDLQQSRVINQANEEVQQIKQSEMDDTAKRQELRSLAEGLTFTLSGMGAEPQQVAQLAQGISPVYKPPTSMTAALFSEDPETVQKAEDILAKQKQRENELLLIKTGLAQREKEGTLNRKKSELVLKHLNKFEAGNDVKQAREALGLAGQIDTLLKIEDAGAFNAALKKLINMSEQRISDVDFKLAMPKGNIIERMENQLLGFFVGKVGPAQRRILTEIAGEIRDSAKQRILGVSKAYSKRAPLLGLTREEFGKILYNSVSDVIPSQERPSFTDKNLTTAPKDEGVFNTIKSYFINEP